MADAHQLFRLEGGTALVTGCGHGGLGYYTAMALCDLGVKLVLSDHPSNEAQLVRTAEDVAARGGSCLTRTCDVTSEPDVEALVAAAVAEYGSISALAHHAGVMLRRSAIETSLDDWNRIISINLTGTWLVNRAVAASMIGSGGGAIVNTSTIYANIVGPLPESAYYASKAGVVNLTRGLAMEWAEHAIRVNCIAPGVFFPTPMTAPLADDPSRLESMAARSMLKRLGRPAEDFAGPVVFLLSPAAAYMTGQLLFVDGGWTAW